MTPGEGQVLLVDDTPSKRYVLGSWLRRSGYTVVEAATGGEALERFGQGGIDLVVLDVRLPDMSGFDVCQQIKSHHRYGTTPVIHVSAAAIQSVDRTYGLEQGADAYLVEPINPSEMLATITSIMRYYQARLHAERLAARLTGLAAATAEMNGSTNLRQLLERAARSGADIFSSAIVLSATGADGANIAASCPGPGNPVTVRPSMHTYQDEPVGVSYNREPVKHWPQLTERDGGFVNVLSVRPRPDRPPVHAALPELSSTQETLPVLELFGQAVASALEAIRQFDAEHNLALTLQRSLLPRNLGRLPGYEVAVRYVPTSDHAEIGGDFYEVLHLDGTVFIAVGDVGGHSLHAATVMAELRHATRAYAVDGHDPASVLDRLNVLIGKLLPGEIATMCLLAIDCVTGQVRMANAGHPPPVLRDGEGVRRLNEHGPLLGIRLRPATESQFVLQPGATLTLYTDGLIERRGEILDLGIQRLVDAAADVENDLEQYASRLLDDIGPALPEDDIALVVIRRQSGMLT